MKNISRLFLFCASILVLLTAACAGQQGSPTAIGTIPGGLTASPPAVETEATGSATTEATTEATSTAATLETPTGAIDLTSTATTLTPGTPGVPVTGSNILLLECQFCVDTFAQALLVIPDTATFQVLTPSASVSSTANASLGCNTVDTFQGRQVVLCRAPENTSLNVNVCDSANHCQQLTIQLQSCPLLGTPAAATDTPGAGAGVPTSTPVVAPTDTPAAGGSPTATP